MVLERVRKGGSNRPLGISHRCAGAQHTRGYYLAVCLPFHWDNDPKPRTQNKFPTLVVDLYIHSPTLVGTPREELKRLPFIDAPFHIWKDTGGHTNTVSIVHGNRSRNGQHEDNV